ncbi:FGGY-family carbohydrate kinase [Actinacidiphila soli]|uniref:FGGY-family carbohydrate kinase n=1 Tax=Actinacidiphila soli TaxID=2487275 RepID=UPI000FCB46AC|nr:FGGY family carbohydrate kinase [Actinacidiphila soli]
MTLPYDVVVGVDLGTTDTKALVITPEGRRVSLARRPTTWTTTAEGRVETSGAALLGDVLATVADALSEASPGVRVLGIGLAGLGESGVVVGPRGEELSPVIAWFDDRGGRELKQLDAGLLAEFPARTGLAPIAQWTLPKLLHLRRTGLAPRPGSRWLNVPEFIAYALCGEQISEPSLASRTALLDQATGEPWDDALTALGVRRDFLPPLLAAGVAAGRVASCEVPELAAAVVTVAGHDHPVAAVGAGAVGRSDLFDSCGTAEVLLRSVPGTLGDGDRARLVGLGVDVGRHALPGHSALMGGMRSGLLMRRILDLVGAHEPGRRDALDRRWAPDADPAGHLSVQGGAGEDNDVILRLRDSVTPDAAWAATLAHIADRTSGLLADMESVVGDHSRAVAAGGWTRLRSVRTSKASVIPRLAFCPVDQPGALGAALFAACAALEGATVEALSPLFTVADPHHRSRKEQTTA